MYVIIGSSGVAEQYADKRTAEAELEILKDAYPEEAWELVEREDEK